MSSVELAKLKRLSSHALYRGRWGQICSRLVFLGLLLLVFWVPLPFASNVPWALGMLELAVAALWVIWLAGFLSGKILLPRMGGAHLVMLALWMLWLAWVFFQYLPLPWEWVQKLSPVTADMVIAARYLDDSARTSMAPLSALPEATLAHFYESLAYAGLFWMVVMVCGVHQRLRALAWVLLLSGLFQAAYGSVMTLSGLEYGFLMVKEYYRGSATGTFINRNHFAGYMELTMAAGFGLLFTTSVKLYGGGWRARALRALDTILSPAVLIRVAIIVMFAGLVLSRSRMGNIAFLTALVLCTGLYLALNWKRDWWRVLLLLLSFVLIDLWWIGGWFGGEALIERFESTRLETELRAKMLPDLLEMVKQWPLTGAGMGSFHVLYPHYQGVEVTGFNQHAHNDYAQFLIEAGIPGTLLLLGIAGITLGRVLLILVRRKNHTVRGAAFAALLATTAIAIHGIADFNLQIPANAATLVIMLAAVWCCGTRSSRRKLIA